MYPMRQQSFLLLLFSKYFELLHDQKHAEHERRAEHDAVDAVDDAAVPGKHGGKILDP
jgi:hypothetical protein